MSALFMTAIGVMYFGTAVAFGLEGKWIWSLVASSWAIGNLALAWISR